MARTINEIRHPEYWKNYDEWTKWRLAYEGGRNFVNQYLTKLSTREKDDDFAIRKKNAYVPMFGASAINIIKNAIYQRMADVVRIGGPTSYEESCKGNLGGVDLEGSTMNTFIGTDVLKEMLVMQKVGVLVDAPRIEGTTLLDKGDNHPYLRLFQAESICSWSHKLINNVCVLQTLLLQVTEEVSDNNYGLPDTVRTYYQLMTRTSSGVKIQFFDNASKETETTTLDIPEIPFHIFCIPVSLMQIVADYQIALMNLESSDISIALKGNYPFFYEFYDKKSETPDFKPPAVPNATTATPEAKNREVAVAGTQGRRYPDSVNPPGFVNPSSETLLASMKKGEQLKEDIYRLVNLNLENAARSAESKQESERTLESNLSFLGLILQKGEMQLAKFWAQFERPKAPIFPNITYPENYSLKTEEERLEEANHLKEHKDDIPSKTFKKATSKKIAKLLVGPDISQKEWKTIVTEIEEARTLTSNADQIIADHQEGLVSDETASEARGYPPGEVEKAKKDHAERLKRIMEAQGGPDGMGAARGIKDMGGQGSSKREKLGKKKRGPADKVT